MILKFVDREQEIAFLEERYRSKNFEFFVIYGRRRVGKTELIKTFLKNKPHIYFLCDKSGTEKNIIRFKKKVAEFFGEPIIATNDLAEIFSYIVKKQKKLIIVFDEFSYLVEKDAAVPSLFQVVVDEVLKDSDMFLILCGSSISMMEKGVLSYKSALYGRKTAHLKVAPLPFGSFYEFFPLNNTEKNIEFYSFLGGVPFYLTKFSDKKSSLSNVKDEIFNKRGKLYEEVDFLLKEELREPDVYKNILTAIADGATKVVEIANKSGIKIQDLDKYLKVLIRLGIIKKEIPITEKRSKKSIYSIDDNFFSFWFTFAEPFKSDLEIGETKNAEEKLKTSFNAFVGRKFEKLVREEILKEANIIQAEKIGSYWGYCKENSERKPIEIDVLALNEKTKECIFCECKWQDNINPDYIMKELLDKAKYVKWYNNNRKEIYAIFAKSFSKKIKIFNDKPVYCFDLKDIEKFFTKKQDWRGGRKRQSPL